MYIYIYVYMYIYSGFSFSSKVLNVIRQNYTYTSVLETRPNALLPKMSTFQFHILISMERTFRTTFSFCIWSNLDLEMLQW